MPTKPIKASERKFGIEIEFTGVSAGRGDYGVQQLLRDAGFPEWANGDIHVDGSGVEVPSPVLCGAAGIKEMKAVLALLTDNGGSVTRADGLHVHHDAPEFVRNKEATLRLLKSWKENQPFIHTLVDDYRVTGWGRGWCKPWDDHMIARLESAWKSTYPPYWDRYFSLNVASLNSHGTIEIRLHEGTLDGDKIEAWIRFGQYFLDSVLKRKRPIPACVDTEQLLKRVRVPKHPNEFLAEIAKKKQPKPVTSVTPDEFDPDGETDEDYDYDPW